MEYSQFNFTDGEPALIQRDMSSLISGAVADQRRHRRVLWRAQVTANELPSDSVFPKLTIAGEVINISAGGVRIISSVPLVPASVVLCSVKLPGLDIPFPTVMQVAWVAKTEDEKYTWGLRYVI
jgi:hypothetical protein